MDARGMHQGLVQPTALLASVCCSSKRGYVCTARARHYAALNDRKDSSMQL